MPGGILVAGKAGYIGSHAVRELMRKGMDVTVVDNLSTGHRWAVPEIRLIVEDIGNRKSVTEIMRSRSIDTVMHFTSSRMGGTVHISTVATEEAIPYERWWKP